METPLTCALHALSPEERSRHGQLVRHWREMGTREELPDGYAFSFPPSRERALALMAFATLERLCCPFLHLSVGFGPGGGPLRLRLTGPEGVKPFVVHELDLELGETR